MNRNPFLDDTVSAIHLDQPERVVDLTAGLEWNGPRRSPAASRSRMRFGGAPGPTIVWTERAADDVD